jgi:hypothetical protein
VEDYSFGLNRYFQEKFDNQIKSLTNGEDSIMMRANLEKEKALAYKQMEMLEIFANKSRITAWTFKDYWYHKMRLYAW